MQNLFSFGDGPPSPLVAAVQMHPNFHWEIEKEGSSEELKDHRKNLFATAAHT